MMPLDDPNWQITLLFLACVTLLEYVMKLVALLLPATKIGRAHV